MVNVHLPKQRFTVACGGWQVAYRRGRATCMSLDQVVRERQSTFGSPACELQILPNDVAVAFILHAPFG